MDINKYSAVVFDLDGTLYDNKRLPMYLILADVFNVFVLSSERKARKQLKGIDFGCEEDLYEALFAKMAQLKRGLTPQKAREWYNTKYMPAQVGILGMYYTPRPCVQDLLQSIREKGMKVVLYSDYGCAEEKLMALNIDVSLFDAVVSAPELGGLKPSKASVVRLMEQQGLSSETCLMVGDRDDTDGDTAKAVGMDFYNVKKKGWDDFLVHFL